MHNRFLLLFLMSVTVISFGFSIHSVEAAAMSESGEECKGQPTDPNAPKPDPRIAQGQAIATEIKADLDWVRGLDIKGNNGNFATEDNKIDGRNMLIQKIYDKYKDNPTRASRLLVALTLYGEFRDTSANDDRPAHWLLATMIMENRARTDYYSYSPQLRVQTFDANGKPVPDRVRVFLDKGAANPGTWLKDKPGAAGFNPNTFTCWNSTDDNLPHILALDQDGRDRTGITVAHRIGNFLGEYFSNQWTWVPPPVMPDNIRYYYSPRSYTGEVSALPFTIVTAPTSFKNIFTGSTSIANPEAIKVAVTKGKRATGAVTPPCLPPPSNP